MPCAEPKGIRFVDNRNSRFLVTNKVVDDLLALLLVAGFYCEDGFLLVCVGTV